jgi:RND superfamily putative drug exporter
MRIEAVTRAVLRRRGVVLLIWLVILLVGASTSRHLSALLTNRISLPGTDSERAEELLNAHFGQSSVGSFTLVVKTERSANALLPAAQAAARRAAAELPTGAFVDSLVIDENVIIAQIASSLDPAAAKGHTAAMRTALGEIPGAEIYLTGLAATEHDTDAVIASDLRRGELLIALPIAIVLLIFIFRSLTFLLPIVFALFTIVTTLGLVRLCANLMELTAYITNFVSLIGLGIAVDYSLLIAHRFREELLRGAPRDDAIVRTMSSAGRAVVFSGSAVAIGLALLVLLPMPFLRGFGVGGLLICAVSVAAAMTLQPVLLSYFGERLDRVKLLPSSDPRLASAPSFWPALAPRIMRHPVRVAAASTFVLLVLGMPLRDIRAGPGSDTGQPEFLESVQGREVVATALGAGATTPTSIVIDTGSAGGANTPELESAVDRLVFALTDDPQVAGLYYMPGNPHFIDASQRFLQLLVLGAEDFGARETLAFVDRLRTQLIPAAGFPDGASVLIGGAAPAGRDFLDLVNRWLPWLVLGVFSATYVLLLRAFRSVVVPLKAIALNALSIAAATGLTVATFQWGWGAPFGLPHYDQIEAWILVMVFAVVFGLSMDYEVFLLSRMREEWDNGAANEEAVSAGLAKTGRLVTTAGLVMFAAFMGFMAGSIVGLQQFGFALAAAILIDVTLVRALLLPATMKLLGRWNWYLPDAIAKALRIAPSRSGRRAD